MPENDENSIGMKFRLIPKGKFLMGFPPSERPPGDEDQHVVKIPQSFYIGVYEVTVGQFRSFRGAKNSTLEAQHPGKGGYGYDEKTRKLVGPSEEYTWEKVGWTQTENHPVVNVSWNDAVAFCGWLTEKEGRRYDLPTEEEWEYACRAGSTTAYSFGDDPRSLWAVANIADLSLKKKVPDQVNIMEICQEWDDTFAFTAPVGSFDPNPWDLYDMHGNVMEWCRSLNGDFVVRGGAWNASPQQCRAASRMKWLSDSRIYSVGFRVVWRPGSKTP
jgi:formylglycine-generating enzyme required for sulfatase activity